MKNADYAQWRSRLQPCFHRRVSRPSLSPKRALSASFSHLITGQNGEFHVANFVFHPLSKHRFVLCNRAMQLPGRALAPLDLSLGFLEVMASLIQFSVIVHIGTASLKSRGGQEIRLK